MSEPTYRRVPIKYVPTLEGENEPEPVYAILWDGIIDGTDYEAVLKWFEKGVQPDVVVEELK